MAFSHSPQRATRGVFAAPGVPLDAPRFAAAGVVVADDESSSSVSSERGITERWFSPPWDVSAVGRLVDALRTAFRFCFCCCPSLPASASIRLCGNGFLSFFFKISC